MRGMVDAYADALWQIAHEEGCEEQLLESLCFVEQIFSEHPSFVTLLSSPMLDRRERVELVRLVFAEQLPTHLLSCLCLLCERREVAFLPSIARQYRERYDRERACVEVVVRSAFSLSEAEKKRIHTSLEKKLKKKCRLVFSVDETLLGGLEIEMDGQNLDGTARGRWKRMREELIR